MCSLCQATFDRFTDLLAHHKNTHNADVNHPLRCRACGRTQTSEAGLVHHQIYVCKMVERPFTCEVTTTKVVLGWLGMVGRGAWGGEGVFLYRGRRISCVL